MAQLAREGSLSQLNYLMSKYSDKLTFNADRRAIQVLDCDGHVAAHLPVSADFADALTLSN